MHRLIIFLIILISCSIIGANGIDRNYKQVLGTVIQLQTTLSRQQKIIAELEQKVRTQNEAINSLEAQLVQMELNNQEDIKSSVENVVMASAGGAVFTWWGRTSCGLGRQRLYTGLMSRGYDTDLGGSPNHYCLPLDPDYASYVSDRQHDTTGRHVLQGVEYQGDPDAIFDNANFGGATFVNQDAPCAVCHITNRTSVVMLPARRTCPIGWVEEYWGYLVGTIYNGTTSSSLECVDNAPEVAYAGGADSVSAEIYNVEVHCGGPLACPNYNDGWELTCVVCSR